MSNSDKNTKSLDKRTERSISDHTDLTLQSDSLVCEDHLGDSLIEIHHFEMNSLKDDSPLSRVSVVSEEVSPLALILPTDSHMEQLIL